MGQAAEAGLILKQMREMGMKQPVFGSSRWHIRNCSLSPAPLRRISSNFAFES